MLGLLLLAGVGFAATALMEHIDTQVAEDDPAQEHDDHTEVARDSMLDDPPDDTAHTASTDDPDLQTSHDASHDSAAADHFAAASSSAHHHSGHHQADHSAASHPQPAHPQPAHQPANDADHHTDRSAADGANDSAAKIAPAPQKLFGTEANDTLHGSATADLIEGNGGDDRLFGHGANDHLVGFDQGRDTIFGNAGDDTLHGFFVQHEPGNLSFAVEDHQADHLHGGTGKDQLYLASDDVGTGGLGADQFHVSWDVDQGHPAQITDYNPAQDKIYVEFANHHTNDDMTPIRPEETTITTEALKDGSGTEILINGHSVAHVLGATNLRPSDIGLIRT